MWKNPFNNGTEDISEEGQRFISTFQRAQSFVNFVILRPEALPSDSQVKQITVRKETSTIRSTIRFEVVGKDRSFRVKQFFYDWSIPAIYADTNLVGQGEAFVVNNVVGTLGTDYKRNRAACYSRWYTQVELSVLEGTFTNRELISFFKGLVPVRNEAVEQIGLLSFAQTSHSARYHYPRWGGHDEVTRVDWFPDLDLNGLNIKNIIDDQMIIPLRSFNHYVTDAVGHKRHSNGLEAQVILRSQKNNTDGIWFWVAPEILSDPIPPVTGNRQRWIIEEITLAISIQGEKTIWIGEQDSTISGWRAHWKHRNYNYHIYVRPSIGFDLGQLKKFIISLSLKQVIKRGKFHRNHSIIQNNTVTTDR